MGHRRRKRRRRWSGWMILGLGCLVAGAGAAWLIGPDLRSPAGAADAPASMRADREAELRREIARQRALIEEQERRLAEMEIQLLLERSGSRTDGD